MVTITWNRAGVTSSRAAVLTDLDHAPAAAGASDACRLITCSTRGSSLGRGGSGVAHLRHQPHGTPWIVWRWIPGLLDRDLEILEGHLLLIRIELLRSRTKSCPRSVHKALKSGFGFFEKGVLGCEFGLLCRELIERADVSASALACASNAARTSAGRRSRRVKLSASTMRET